MVKEYAIFLRSCGGVSDNVDYGDVFGVCACDCVDARQLTDAEGSYNCGNAFDAGISICSIA
jgi:hypothetical protein